MFDKKGRVWLSANVRGKDNPAFCKKGSDHPSAKVFPLERRRARLAMLDPKTMKYTFIDTCFGTHHPQFGYDADDTLWLSGTGPVAGWVNTKVFEETGDAAKAQGWSPFVLDTNGNGKRRRIRRAEPAERSGEGQAHRPGLRPVCGDAESGRRFDLVHGRRVRRAARLRALRSARPACRRSINVPTPGFGIRGGDIDKNGVAWGSASSGHLVSFDRRKCKGPLNGPNATGNHCPEGWSRSTAIRARASTASDDQRRRQLLHLGRPAQYARPRRERPDLDRQPQ